MDRSRMAEECGSHVIFALVVLLAVVQRAQGLAVSSAYHIQFCNGDKIDISCPKDWQIHLSSAYYVYVHGVQLGGPNCRQHTNSSKQCLRKIQFYDPDYFSLMIQSCQSKQRCEEGLVARIGDPKVCWDFPRSPSDYLIFSYVCVNVHIEQPTTTYMGKYATTTTIAAQPRGSTKPSGITGKPHGSTGYWTTAISYRPTTWPWAVRTTSYVSWPVTTSRGGQATRLLFYTSTTSGWPHRTGSSGYSTSTADQSGVGTTRTRNPEGRKPVASSKTEASRQLDKLMVIAVPIAVVVMISAIITIAAVIACRSPKKSSLKRKLSQNSSVYFSNADRHSLGGDSVQTRASIHGIVNLGYDVNEIACGNFVDRVILDAYEPEVGQKTVDLPAIHINPSFSNQDRAPADREQSGDLLTKEPLAEQVYPEFHEFEPNCNYI